MNIGTRANAAQAGYAQLAQQGIALNAVPPAVPSWSDVEIKKVANGFIVAIGCQVFVSKTWVEASKGLDEYWRDPVAAQKKYCAA